MQVLGILVGSSTRTLRVPERADLESVVAVLCVVAQTVWRLRGGAPFAPRAPGTLTGRRSVQSDAEFVALESGFARRASSRFTPASGRCGDCALQL